MNQLQVVSRLKEYSEFEHKQQPSDKKTMKTRYDQNIRFVTSQSLNSQLSFTQQEIFSRQIISEVIERSKKKTVKHDINKISIQAQLYICPKQINKDEFAFDTIPPPNKQFVSTSSQNIKQINRRLSQSKKLAQRLVQMGYNNRIINEQNKKKRSQSCDNINKRVSVSGLVSYNFNSVNARRSLGSIPKETQEKKINNQIEQIKKKNSSSIDRFNRIIKRKPNIFSLNKIQLGKAAVCDFYTPTDKFLDIMQTQNQKDSKIYGEKMEKLTCIKQYMQNQKTSYDQAKFIVEAIQNTKNKNIQVQEQKKKKIIIDDNKQLLKRKKVIISKNKKIMLKHLCFTEV